MSKQTIVWPWSNARCLAKQTDLKRRVHMEHRIVPVENSHILGACRVRRWDHKYRTDHTDWSTHTPWLALESESKKPESCRKWLKLMRLVTQNVCLRLFWSFSGGRGLIPAGRSLVDPLVRQSRDHNNHLLRDSADSSCSPSADSSCSRCNGDCSFLSVVFHKFCWFSLMDTALLAFPPKLSVPVASDLGSDEFWVIKEQWVHHFISLVPFFGKYARIRFRKQKSAVSGQTQRSSAAKFRKSDFLFSVGSWKI